MNVVVCRTPGELAAETRPCPVRHPGEVLVRIRRVGICGTDYHIYRGTQPYLSYPRVCGHELAGEVVEADDESGFRAGQPVCILPYLHCGTCVACRRGKPNCCANIEVLGVHRDGGLAGYVAVDAKYVLDASGLTFDQAAMVEFLAIGHHAVDRGAVSAGQRVLVVGAGPIGMGIVLFARRRGAEVTVVDGNAARAGFCVDALGAAHGMMVGPELKTKLDQVSDGDFFDVVFDATGNAEAMAAGLDYVAHGGAYVLVSVVSADLRFSDPEFHKRETSLLGSRNATVADFAAVIAAMRAGDIPTDALHTHSARIDDLPERLPQWMLPEAGVIKALVEV